VIFVDTAFLLASLDPCDALHAVARARAALIRERLLVTEHVLWETLNFVASTANRAKGEFLVREIVTSPHFEVVPASPELFSRGLDLYAARPDKGWSLTDCISFVVMGERGLMEALTGDHHFEQAGFRALLLVG
jgi:predicted nucleic acid-binding protein